MKSLRSIIKQQCVTRLPQGLRRYYFTRFSDSPWREKNDKCGCIFVHVPRTVSNKFGIELPVFHTNSSQRTDYQDYYTLASRKLIGEINERDVATFGYSF